MKKSKKAKKAARNREAAEQMIVRKQAVIQRWKPAASDRVDIAIGTRKTALPKNLWVKTGI